MASRDELCEKIRSYEFLAAHLIFPLFEQRKRTHVIAQNSLLDLDARAESMVDMCSSPASSAFKTSIELGEGVRVEAEIEAGEHVLVDIGGDVYLEMHPHEALLFSRRMAAEKRIHTALCARDLRLVSEDLISTLEALAQLKAVTGSLKEK